MYLLGSSDLGTGKIAVDADRERLAFASILCMAKLGHFDVATALGKVAARLRHLSRSLGAFLRRDLLALRRRDQRTFFAVLDIYEQLRYEGHA